jgi:hypothetical protein
VKFTRDDVDAVREQLVLDKSQSRIRNVLHRLEERGEAEVSYTSSGVLSIQMHQITDFPQIHSTLSSGAICNPNSIDSLEITSSNLKGLKRYSSRNGLMSPDKVKKVLPIKMRKFFDSNGKLKSEIAAIPLTQNSAKSNPISTASTNRRGSKVSADMNALGKNSTFKPTAISDVKLSCVATAKKKSRDDENMMSISDNGGDEMDVSETIETGGTENCNLNDSNSLEMSSRSKNSSEEVMKKAVES